MVDSKDTISGIDLADQLVQDLRETYGAIWLFMPRVVALIERLKAAEVERDKLLKEHIDLQIYPKDMIAQLEEQVRSLTADKQAWMAENTELLTQVSVLTLERDLLEHDHTFCYAKEESLREQVERLTTQLEAKNVP